MKKITPFIFLAIITLMSACSSNRYQYSQDHLSGDIPPLTHIEDAVPRYEPYSRGGNRNYRVNGIHYKVLKGIDAFTEQGNASWYGNKFHGHLTSNGERYDMFTMSAAHKNLPLPSYVKVTNLENSKTVIVRLNDRGPFHEGRIIDLSYVAAKKLDILKYGTAKVKVELIKLNPPPIKALHVLNDENVDEDRQQTQIYIQYLVTSQAAKAKQLGEKISEQYQLGNITLKQAGHYRLRLGPIASEQAAQTILSQLQIEFRGAFIVP